MGFHLTWYRHCSITVPSLHRHCTVTARYLHHSGYSNPLRRETMLPKQVPSLHHHRTITAPSLHKAPSLHHHWGSLSSRKDTWKNRAGWPRCMISWWLHDHCMMVAWWLHDDPSLHHHCTRRHGKCSQWKESTAPSPHHHRTITPFPSLLSQVTSIRMVSSTLCSFNGYSTRWSYQSKRQSWSRY